MRLCLIPVKPLAAAKARLSPVFSAEERRRLSLAMLADVLEAARGLDAVWVLSSDQEAASLATAAGAESRPDPTPGAGLNASLDAATVAAIGAGATGLLVVAADLPAATAADLEAMSSEDGVALAADAEGSGTNALWRSPPDAIPAAFGPGSRAIHEALARARRLPVRVVERPGLALDVDTPEAVAAAWALGTGPATRRALEEMGLPERLQRTG